MELAVGRVVAVEAAAPSAHVVVALGVLPHAAARVGARVGIDARLKPERVNAVNRRLNAVRETLRVELEDAVLAVAAEKAVVDVYVDVARLLEPVRRHRLRGPEYDFLGNVAAERVPARPAHERADLRVVRRRNLRGVEKLCRAPCGGLAVEALETAQVDIRLPSGEIDADALVAFGAVAVFDALVGGGWSRLNSVAERRLRPNERKRKRYAEVKFLHFCF